jgi:hypothetical protein
MSQIQNFKPNSLVIGGWDFGFIWNLGFGIWDFLSSMFSSVNSQIDLI